ncbi:MAG: hypothetical protein VB065_12355 [Eubacteriales bacterium]|nr:hypothetical protein [Eubacteriales bacterium]
MRYYDDPGVAWNHWDSTGAEYHEDAADWRLGCQRRNDCCGSCWSFNGRCCCNMCCCRGPRGPQGPTGPQGPAGVIVSAYFSNIGAQTVIPGGVVAFNQTPVPSPLPAPFSFAAPGQITISAPGRYAITYYALAQSANATLAVFVSGTEAPLTRYAAYGALEHVYGQAIINVGAIPAAITLRNVDPAQNLVLATGPLAGTVNLSLMISKLS